MRVCRRVVIQYYPILLNMLQYSGLKRVLLNIIQYVSKSRLLHPIVHPGACHRCTCSRSRFLEIKPWQLKSTKRQKQRELDAASGKTIAAEPVVIFNGEGKRVTVGPAAKSYERARAATGAHLIFNAFWLITSFCCYQIYAGQSASVHE